MKVKTLVEFSGVPKGTIGVYVELIADFIIKKKVWDVTWDLPRSKPLVDQFDELEFKKYLEVIEK